MGWMNVDTALGSIQDCKKEFKSINLRLSRLEGVLVAQLRNKPNRQSQRYQQTRLSFAAVALLAVGPALAGTTIYSYDVHGRLVGVVTPNGAVQTILVFAFDNAGNRTNIQMSCQDVLAPNAPTGLSATVMASNWIRLNWTAITDACGRAVASYNVYRGGATVATAGATSYDDKTLAPNTPYTYSVTAVDTAKLESAKSVAASATTLPGVDTTPPSVPSGLQGVVISGTRVNLSWGASQDNSGGSGLAGYEIFRNGVLLASSPVASYSDATVQSGMTYSYTVRAYDVTGNKSAMSNQIGVVTPDTVSPNAPGVPVITNIQGASASAAWSAATDNVAVAAYRYSVDGGATWTTTTATTASLSGLAPYTRYTFTVQARDSALNWGPVSGNAFTTLDNVPPSAPGQITFGSVAATSFNASWSPASDNVGVVKYQYSVNSGATWIDNLTTSVSVSGLAVNTSYNFWVRAVDAAANSSAVATAVVKTAFYNDAFSLNGAEWFINSNLGKRSGFIAGQNGRLSPATTVTGRTISGFYSSTYRKYYDDEFGIKELTVLSVSGFATDPGTAWLQSLSGANGVSLTGASATYAGCTLSGQLVCTWSWPGYYDLSGAISLTLVHQ
jgi:chitodextrinase